MKKYIGTGLILIGLFMLFKEVRVSSFGFWRIGIVNTSAIVLVLLILSAIAVVVQRNKITIGCLIASVSMLVLSLILGTRLPFAYMSLIDLLLVFVPIIVGLGLVIREFIEIRKLKEDKRNE